MQSQLPAEQIVQVMEEAASDLDFVPNLLCCIRNANLEVCIQQIDRGEVLVAHRLEELAILLLLGVLEENKFQSDRRLGVAVLELHA